MTFESTLYKATLLKRYKRFLADVVFEGETTMTTVHCPNTGSMRNCIVDESPCWLSKSLNKKRKYAFTWELATMPSGALACINTQRANHVVGQALTNKQIPELAEYSSIQREVKYGEENSRIDFLLADESDLLPKCYVEVKSVTLEEAPGRGYFPDAVSERGSKHLRELIHIKQQGHRAVLLFCVMHTGIEHVAPAQHIDTKYTELFYQAVKAGVEVYAYGCTISPQSIVVSQSLPVALVEK